MKKLLTILLLLINIVGFSQTNFNANDLLKPRTGKQTLVNDFAGILTEDQRQALETKLYRFDDTTSTQIAVVIVPNLGGRDVTDFAVELGRAWGVGGKTNNNGVVLLISIEDRQLAIVPGYGLEGSLPDVICKQIGDDIIVPRFKGNDYYNGINNGTNAIIQAVQGKYKAPKNYHKKGISAGKIVFTIFLIIILLSIFSGGRGGGGYMSRRGGRWLMGGPFWSGGWGHGGSSSGGGGGFGGFGGGSFGGGGSSSSW